jgi:branched-chain amino acid transport system substrate-binding protein
MLVPLRISMVATLVASLCLPLAASADPRLDGAVQAALDIGKVVGAANACPTIPPARAQALTDRFKSELSKYAVTGDENATIATAFDQGVIFAGQKAGAGRAACEDANRALADWEATTVPLLPQRPAATASRTPTPPPVATPPATPQATPPRPATAAPPSSLPPQPPLTPAPATATGPQGITDREIRFGMAAPFSGPAQALGRQMRIGVDIAFSAVNDAGGVNGRKLVLVAADDGYEPARTPEAMAQLFERDDVFGFIGNVGTPTTAVALPYAMNHRVLFFGAFTGAPLLRSDPPDRYVFNYRASYAEETFAAVHFLVKTRSIRPNQIAVFAQQDGYGDAGFEGVAGAMRALDANIAANAIPRFGYQRNTEDIEGAAAQLLQYQRQHAGAPIKAIVMVATAKAAAKFIGFTHDRVPNLTYTNVSFVGSTALARELMAIGPRVTDGVIVTQVVPPVDGFASVVLKYKAALAKYAPNEAPDYVSFEGYPDANVLIEGLRRAGPTFDTERLVDTLESIRDFDLGVGPKIHFDSSEHQALHKVWGTILDNQGHFKPIALE